jgi:phenol 2-monooxygenase
LTAEDNKIADEEKASHTHSPKAAQGMNTSMHDTFNLSWKLNLAIRGLSKPELLSTYQTERQKIAQDLIDFDFEHAAAFANGDSTALAENFTTNVGFISGFGVKYAPNALNMEETSPRGVLRCGELVAPAKVTRYIDANPVNIELDIPLLGQFRTFFFVSDIHASSQFLALVTKHISSVQSVMGRASLKAAKSYARMPVSAVETDQFVQPDRYTGASKLFTFATVTSMEKASFEISDLPPLLQKSRWTLYLDDLKDKKSGSSCTEKWVGSVETNEAVIVNIRPDGYVGAINRFRSDENARACRWLDSYYGAFLST